jgi:hypothetical protein
MSKPRVLDARHIANIFRWALRRKGEVHERRSDTGETIVTLRRTDSTSIDMHLRAHDINVLVEELRSYTAVDVFASPRALAQVLAKIAIIANYYGPKVSGLSANVKAIAPIVREICTEFAIACAISFADSHRYVIDPSRIRPRETLIALLMKDEEALTRTFSEALHIAPSAARRGRHAAPKGPEPSTEEGPEGLLRDIEEQFADADPIPGPGPNSAERQLSAGRFRILYSICALRGWNADKVLKLINEQLSPHDAEEGAEVVLTYIEQWLANAQSIPEPGPNGAEHQLSATSYWNLRSIAEGKGWNAEEVLILIGEHLSPILVPDFVYHSDTVSGADWQRLHIWIFGPGGRA